MNDLIELKVNTNIDEDRQKANEFDRFLQVRVTSPLGLENAITSIRVVEKFKDELEKKRKSITIPIDQAKKAVMDLFRPVQERCEQVARHLREEANTYQFKVEQARQEAQRKLEEKARIEEERKRKALLERAEKAKAEGKDEKAEILAEKAEEIAVVAPVIPQAVKPEGVSSKKVWKARILDYHKILQGYLWASDEQKEAHQRYFNKLAQASKGAQTIDGIEFYEESVTIIRK